MIYITLDIDLYSILRVGGSNAYSVVIPFSFHFHSIVIRIVFLITVFVCADADDEASSINEIKPTITGSLVARPINSTNRGRFPAERENRIELPLLFSQHHEINGIAFTERIPPKI